MARSKTKIAVPPMPPAPRAKALKAPAPKAKSVKVPPLPPAPQPKAPKAKTAPARRGRPRIKTIVLHTRVSPEIAKAVQAAARDAKMTVSAFICELLRTV